MPVSLGIGAATEAPRKYRNKPTVVDGIRFDSKAEARRYGELKLLEASGHITDLELQPKFPLHASNAYNQWQKIGTYVADFQYRDVMGGKHLPGDLVVEDVKSEATAKNSLFRWKRKHFEAEYGIKLRIVT